MKLREIWRYPVKSMQGEQVAAATLTPRGIDGDRAYAVQAVSDGRLGSAKHPRRFGRLFECSAATTADGVTVTIAGERHRVEASAAALSAFLGEAVTVSSEAPAATAVDYVDLEDAPHTFAPMGGTFFDTAPIHVIFADEFARLQALRRELNLDVRRFRPNLVVDGPAPDGGAPTLHLGDCEVVLSGPCPRCIMTTLAQPGGISRDVEVLKTIARDLAGNFGFLGHVRVGGPLQAGAPVTFGE